MLIFSSFSTPTLLLPIISREKNVSTWIIALIFSAFPLGAFPASIVIGKMMRFYQKDKLLLIFNLFSSLSRLSLGFLTYTEDSTQFMILGFIGRLCTGISEGCLIPVLYSFIPDLFPDDIMIKYGILETWGSVGAIVGSPFASLLYENFGYLAVFVIMATINLVVGMIIILYFLRADEIVRFKNETKESLPLKKALFSNFRVLLDTFYLFFFFLPSYITQTGFETYFETLTSSLYVTAFVYCLTIVGMTIGIYLIKYFYKQQYEKKMLFIFAIIIILALNFFGPDTIFGITNNTTKIVLISFALVFSGLGMESIFIISTKVLINDLMEVFPEEKELCADFANGLFTASYTLDQFFGPILGYFLNDLVGYENSGLYYSIFCLIFCIIYWSIRKTQKNDYNQMVEEREGNTNQDRKKDEI